MYLYLLYVSVSDQAAKDDCPNLVCLDPEALAEVDLKLGSAQVGLKLT